MEYRVEELARATGLNVGTVRFYQARGLLPPPRRQGRVALYDETHRERIARIRSLHQQGLTLEGVRRALDASHEEQIRDSLLSALSETEGEHLYRRSELAAAAGLPEVLIEQAERAGLMRPLERDGEHWFTAADRQTAEAARALLEGGLPLHELLPLALEHASNTRETVDRAVELFRRFVREDDGAARPTEEVTAAFRTLLPAVTTLVALFFQRTLVQCARERLAETGPSADLEAAIAATESARLEVSWS